jgi:hypothetical protein
VTSSGELESGNGGPQNSRLLDVEEEIVMRVLKAEETSTTPERPVRVLGPLGRFGLHFLEMCAAMCIGGGALGFLFFGGAAALGYSDVRSRAPVLTTLVLAFNLAVAMVVWMRFRGMQWRPTVEMAASSVVVGLLMVGAYGLGIAPKALLVQGVCGLACVAMLAVMVYRFRLYSRPHAHHRVHATT